MLLPSVGAESDTNVTPFYIFNAASNFGIDQTLMYAICTVESRCRSRVINHDDARKAEKDRGIVKKSFGLFQLQIDTAKFLGFKRYTEVSVVVTKRHKTKIVIKKIDHILDLLKPEINAWYAAKLLNHLYKRYHNTPKVISAFNAGHAITSNKDYVLKVLKAYSRLKIDHQRTL